MKCLVYKICVSLSVVQILKTSNLFVQGKQSNAANPHISEPDTIKCLAWIFGWRQRRDDLKQGRERFNGVVRGQHLW